MRLLALTAIFSCCAMTGLGAQPPTADVAGTWSGPAACRHGGGETLMLTIERAPDGTLRGSTDWARSTSDGRRGRPVPFTTLVVVWDVPSWDAVVYSKEMKDMFVYQLFGPWVVVRESPPALEFDEVCGGWE